MLRAFVPTLLLALAACREAAPPVAPGDQTAVWKKTAAEQATQISRLEAELAALQECGEPRQAAAQELQEAAELEPPTPIPVARPVVNPIRIVSLAAKLRSRFERTESVAWKVQIWNTSPEPVTARGRLVFLDLDGLAISDSRQTFTLGAGKVSAYTDEASFFKDPGSSTNRVSVELETPWGPLEQATVLDLLDFGDYGGSSPQPRPSAPARGVRAWGLTYEAAVNQILVTGHVTNDSAAEQSKDFVLRVTKDGTVFHEETLSFDLAPGEERRFSRTVSNDGRPGRFGVTMFPHYRGRGVGAGAAEMCAKFLTRPKLFVRTFGIPVLLLAGCSTDDAPAPPPEQEAVAWRKIVSEQAARIESLKKEVAAAKRACEEQREFEALLGSR